MPLDRRSDGSSCRAPNGERGRIGFPQRIWRARAQKAGAARPRLGQTSAFKRLEDIAWVAAGETANQQSRVTVCEHEGRMPIAKPAAVLRGAMPGIVANAWVDAAGEIVYRKAAANKAYAWSSPIEGSDKRRFFAVLHVPPVTSPVEAVRAAIVAEHRAKAD